jgi:hypothetical protein
MHRVDGPIVAFCPWHLTPVSECPMGCEDEGALSCTMVGGMWTPVDGEDPNLVRRWTGRVERGHRPHVHR